MKHLFVFRGLPGSGKTTVAEAIADIVCSADDYFVKDGVYQFNPEELKTAHSICQARVRNAMGRGIGKIAVANTHTREWEMQVYFDLAKEFGYQVHSLIVENRHEGRNIHGVPQEAIAAMKERFEIVL